MDTQQFSSLMQDPGQFVVVRYNKLLKTFQPHDLRADVSAVIHNEGGRFRHERIHLAPVFGQGIVELHDLIPALYPFHGELLDAHKAADDFLQRRIAQAGHED